MFCLRSLTLCFLLAVAIDVSSGVHLNTENFIELSGYPNLKENEFIVLGFVNDYVETIAEDTFKNCVNARLVSLYKNPVSVIPKNLFKYNKQLRMLYIRDNQIATFHPDTFAAQASVVQLFLDQNYLTEIDEGLFRYNTNLTSLDLSQNRLTEIKPNTFETLVHLKKINLEDNRLATVPENLFAHNLKLVQINLSKNSIKVLPATLFKNNVNLKNLYLQKNRLSSFDLNVLLSNPQMTDLGLYNNDLTEIVFYDKLQQYWPKFSNISLTGNNFKCSYFRSIYDYCIEKGYTVYTQHDEEVDEDEIVKEAAKYPDDQFYHGSSCIEDKDFETVSAARISAPIAAFADVPKTYTVREKVDEPLADLAYAFTEGFVKEQEACEEGHVELVSSFVMSENCDYFTAY